MLSLAREQHRRRAGGVTRTRASDAQTLRLRCGPDSALPATKHVTVFGAGSIGSHVALDLAQAGLGKLHLVDGDRCAPATSFATRPCYRSAEQGARDRMSILLSAPWTEVSTTESNHGPDACRAPDERQ